MTLKTAYMKNRKAYRRGHIAFHWSQKESTQVHSLRDTICAKAEQMHMNLETARPCTLREILLLLLTRILSVTDGIKLK